MNFLIADSGFAVWLMVFFLQALSEAFVSRLPDSWHCNSLCLF